MLYLVRHAQSIENRDKYLGFYTNPRDCDGDTAHTQSVEEVGLTDEGVREAEWLSSLIEPLYSTGSVAHSSEYKRAKDTAKIALSGVNGAKVEVTPLLNEQHYGDATYMTKEELFTKYPESKEARTTTKHLWVPPGKGGESLVDMIANRSVPYSEIAHNLTLGGQCVIAFSHHTTIMGLRTVLERRTPEDIIDETRRNKLPNAGVLVYESSRTGFKLVNRIEPPK